MTDWAWVNVGCDTAACVDLVPPTVRQCIDRVLLGLQLGTLDPPQEGEQRVADVMPDEVQQAVQLLTRIAERLPEDVQLQNAPTVDEVREATRGSEG